MPRRNTRTNRTAVDMFEHLEGRALLSAPYDFAGVGVRFGMVGPAVFQTVGTLNADDTVSGSTTLAGLEGAPLTGPIEYATMQMMSRGRLATTPASGGVAYDQQAGASFVSEAGYAIGSLFGRVDSVEPTTDIAFYFQRETNDPTDWLQRAFDVQYIEFNASGASFKQAYFAVGGGNAGGLAVSWSDPFGEADPDQIAVDSTDADGTLHLADGKTIFTSSQFVFATDSVVAPSVGEFAFIIDADNSDGTVGIGIARYRSFFEIGGGAGHAAVYRASILASGPVGENFFAAQGVAPSALSARVVIDLDIAGRFSIYDMADYDNGGRTVINSGVWGIKRTEDRATRWDAIVLTSDSGAVVNFMNTRQLGLVAASAQANRDAAQEQLFGVASTFSGLPAERFIQGGHVALEGGRAIFYEGVDDANFDPTVQSWYSQDLSALWGGGGGPSSLIAVDSTRVQDSQGVFHVVGVDGDGNVVAWERTHTGVWNFRNVTAETGADPIVSDITIFRMQLAFNFGGLAGPGFGLGVAGKNAEGEMVVISPDLQYAQSGYHAWFGRTIPASEIEGDVPVWSGPVQGYATSSGVNIAGLNDEGEVVIFWTSNETQGMWVSTNVSEIAGTPALEGALSVMVTPWHAVHITGLDSTGAVHVTWWAPGFGGDWVHSDLTSKFGGPRLDATRTAHGGKPVISFIGVGDSLNIAGFDAATGNYRIYWWSPATEWNIGAVAVPFTTAVYTNNLGAIGGAAGYSATGQSIYGYRDDGTFTRSWWAPGNIDLWHADFLTDMAVMVIDG